MFIAYPVVHAVSFIFGEVQGDSRRPTVHTRISYLLYLPRLICSALRVGGAQAPGERAAAHLRPHRGQGDGLCRFACFFARRPRNALLNATL